MSFGLLTNLAINWGASVLRVAALFVVVYFNIEQLSTEDIPNFLVCLASEIIGCYLVFAYERVIHKYFLNKLKVSSVVDEVSKIMVHSIDPVAIFSKRNGELVIANKAFENVWSRVDRGRGECNNSTPVKQAGQVMKGSQPRPSPEKERTPNYK